MKREKTGGRTKGTPNKLTYETRQRYQDFIDGHFDDFLSAWQAIEDPKEKAEVYIKASKFVVPALQSVNIQSSTGKDHTVEEQLRKLSEEQS